MATRAHCRARRASLVTGVVARWAAGDTMALVIVDKAIYVDGQRRPCGDLSDELDALRDGGSPGSFLWIGLKNPTQAEFDEVNEELQLHPLAVEDAIHGRQRAKVELYETSVFVVLKPLRYVEQTSDIETGELMCFVGDHFIVTVRRGEASPLAGLRHRLEAEPGPAAAGPDGRAARHRRRRRRQLRRSSTARCPPTSTTSRPRSSPAPTWTPRRSTASSARCSSSAGRRCPWPPP